MQQLTFNLLFIRRACEENRRAAFNGVNCTVMFFEIRNSKNTLKSPAITVSPIKPWYNILKIIKLYKYQKEIGGC